MAHGDKNVKGSTAIRVKRSWYLTMAVNRLITCGQFCTRLDTLLVDSWKLQLNYTKEAKDQISLKLL